MNGEVFDGLILFYFFRDREVVKGEFLRTEFSEHWASWDLAQEQVLRRLGATGSTGGVVVGVRGREHQAP